MFCKYCESLDLDAAAPWHGSGAPHHESFADLVASADNGCELCKRITGDAKKDWRNRFEECLHSSERITCHYDDLGQSLYWRAGRRASFLHLYICAAKGKLSISASHIG
jgi:hypothetical protein